MNGIVIDKPYKSYSSSEKSYVDHEQDLSAFYLKNDSYLPKSRKGQRIDVFQRIIEKEPELTLKLNGEEYKLARELEHIVDQIEEAREILDYPLDWDEEGGLPTDKETFTEAVSFIVSYALWVFENHDEIIIPPYIDIMKDGAVSVHWETDRAQLLIIFNKAEDFKPEEEKLAYFYAERKENNIPFKSAIKPGAEVDEFIGLWMKKNLT